MDNSYANSGNGRYVLHPKYAADPQHYVRAYLLLQKDLLELFDYVEPSDQNLGCYSYRIHELLLRACVEIEANCRAILLENGYKKRPDDLKMADYIKIEQSHKLSHFEMRVPTWSGATAVRMPFASWDKGGSLAWYQAYNATKHDRHTEFRRATFEHAIDAVSGCLVILSAQFLDQDFSGQSALLSTGWPGDGMEDAIGNYFRVGYPKSWPVADRYDFNWQTLETDPNPFQAFPYS
jgi:hypothetical protein